MCTKVTSVTSVYKLDMFVASIPHSATKQYLDRGGMPEYALDAVLARCVEEHEEMGDGTFVQDEEHAKALEALPTCANDGNWPLWLALAEPTHALLETNHA